MATINTLEEMKQYVLRKLGMPVINVEMSDDQLEDAIGDSIQDFQRYNHDEGTYRDYIVFTTTSGVGEYPLSSTTDINGNAISDIQSIYDFTVSFGVDGINTLFSPAHVLLHQQYVEQGGYPGGPAYGSPNGLILTNYQTAMMYLEQINQMFGKYYTADYIPGRDIIRISPTPSTAVTGVLQVFKKQAAIAIYNNILFKKLAVARAGVRWGRNLNKTGGQLPGGLTINSQEIISQYKEEEEDILQRLFDESEPPDFFVA